MTAQGTVIAIDVGGTTIKGAVIDASGATHAQCTHETAPQRGVDAIVGEIGAVIGELRAAQPDARAIGIVVPGLVDPQAGVARFSANLGFRELPLRALLEHSTGLPVTLGHDVGAAGLAEHTIGASATCDDCLLAVIGTGIAAAIFVNGEQVHGAAGIAGELGHIPVWPDGEACPCGQRGCLERYASAGAISRHYEELSGASAVSARTIAQLQSSDPSAARVWRTATVALAIAFATCTLLLDPGVIVLAGGLADAGETLLEPVRSELARRVRLREPPPLVLSVLGERAGQFGAALLAWRALGVHDFEPWVRRALPVQSTALR